MLNKLYYYIDEPLLFFICGILAAGACGIVIFMFLKKTFSGRIMTLEQRLKEIEQEFEPIKERSKANLRVFKQVVYGLDDIVQNVKQAINEDEQFKIVPVPDKKELVEK